MNKLKQFPRQPSFIYGGEEFSATPPRVAGWYGEKVQLGFVGMIWMAMARCLHLCFTDLFCPCCCDDCIWWQALILQNSSIVLDSPPIL